MGAEQDPSLRDGSSDKAAAEREKRFRTYAEDLIRVARSVRRREKGATLTDILTMVKAASQMYLGGAYVDRIFGVLDAGFFRREDPCELARVHAGLLSLPVDHRDFNRHNETDESEDWRLSHHSPATSELAEAVRGAYTNLSRNLAVRRDFLSYLVHKTIYFCRVTNPQEDASLQAQDYAKSVISGITRKTY